MIDPGALVVVLVAASAYAVGVRRLARAGRRWPPSRGAAFATALAAALVATQGPVAADDTERLTSHMVQHVLLGMVVPLLAVLSAPMTLALQSGGPATRSWLRRFLHGRLGRVLANPVVGWMLFGGGMVALYLTPLLDLAAREPAVHIVVHVHLVLAGTLFLLPLAGADVLPRAVPFGARLLAVLAAVPFHAFLGLVLLSAKTPIAPDAYPSLDDQRQAAGILLASGELLTVSVAAIVFASWWAADQREAARLDRREL